MKLNFLRMLLFLLGFIFWFNEIVSGNNRFLKVEKLHSFSDYVIEEQLKVINKPASKIIKSTHGDTYGCVDFYKQPAFEHLLMKNHLSHYKMHRTSFIKNSTKNNRKFGFLWENGKGCPIGTVPIKRVTKDELLRLNLFSEKCKPQGSWNFSNNQYKIEENQHHFAVSRTKGGQEKSYNGASMIISINKPKVKFPQFSSARMHVQIGDDYIQIGWTVNPKLYSDSRTRRFVYTKAGENQCYNHLCPIGIISVRSDFPLDGVLEPPSVRGSRNVSLEQWSIDKDKSDGNWFLTQEGVTIGFWPKNIFQQSSANKVEWGGEVYSASMPGPEMGNGYFPVGHVAYDSNIVNITIVDENFKTDDRVNNTEEFSDNAHRYKVKDEIYSQFAKHIVYFGGLGII